MKSFQPCRKCASSPTPGYVVVGGEMQECSCHKLYKSVVAYVKFIQQIGIPEKYIKYQIKDYIINNLKREKSQKNLSIVSSVIDMHEEFLSSGSNLYIFGPANSQKTSVATYLCKSLFNKGYKTYYTFMPMLVGTLMRANNFSSDEDTMKDKRNKENYYNTDFLFIDDAFDTMKLYLTNPVNNGKIKEENTTEYKVTLLDGIMRYRINEKKPTIYVSPNPVDKININIFSPSIKEMLKKDCLYLEFTDVLSLKQMQNSFLQRLSS